MIAWQRSAIIKPTWKYYFYINGIGLQFMEFFEQKLKVGSDRIE